MRPIIQQIFVAWNFVNIPFFNNLLGNDFCIIHIFVCVLEDVFVKYGPVRDVWVARKPPGFAFVEMEDPRDAEDAARGLDGSRICGAR